MKVFEDDGIIQPCEASVFGRVHVLAVEQEKIGELHDLAELARVAYSARIHTDVVSLGGAAAHELEEKVACGSGFTAPEGHSPFGVGIKEAVTVHDVHDFLNRHVCPGHDPCLGGADVHAGPAVLAEGSVAVIAVFRFYDGSVRAGSEAGSAGYAEVFKAEKLGLETLRLRVAAPEAV